MILTIGETRAFCCGCGRMVFVTIVEGTNIGLCNECLEEYEERYKLHFPQKTLEEFVASKRIFFV